MTPWLLMDYGDVISLPNDPAVAARLVERLGLAPEVFAERYWGARAEFDAGGAASAYWEGIAGRPLSDDEVGELVDLDCAGWARLNNDVLAVLDEQRAAGVRLALLSNAPHFQADAFDQLAWTDRFEHVLVSARLGLMKPDPAIFERALEVLDAAPDEVTFVDDKEPNVAGARSVGLRGIVYVGVRELRADLGG